MRIHCSIVVRFQCLRLLWEPWKLILIVIKYLKVNMSLGYSWQKRVFSGES